MHSECQVVVLFCFVPSLLLLTSDRLLRSASSQSTLLQNARPVSVVMCTCPTRRKNYAIYATYVEKMPLNYQLDAGTDTNGWKCSDCSLVQHSN
ncbi:Beta-amylase Tri a [Trichinella spiralis]|uniref:Beta-amylase Tri a n=1 Tax=Trichinella spiralis TaxID=6334 RepID=A0ABR3KP80_TRISP